MWGTRSPFTGLGLEIQLPFLAVPPRSEGLKRKVPVHLACVYCQPQLGEGDLSIEDVEDRFLSESVWHRAYFSY